VPLNLSPPSDAGLHMMAEGVVANDLTGAFGWTCPYCFERSWRPSEGSTPTDLPPSRTAISQLLPSYRNALGGLVAETLGGGFKLKVLDYATTYQSSDLRAALAGTTAEEQSLMFVGDTLREVATLIVKHLDHLQLLQNYADRLYNVVACRYSSDAGIDRPNRIFRA
jgi:hypothetical protein